MRGERRSCSLKWKRTQDCVVVYDCVCKSHASVCRRLWCIQAGVLFIPMTRGKPSERAQYM